MACRMQRTKKFVLFIALSSGTSLSVSSFSPHPTRSTRRGTLFTPLAYAPVREMSDLEEQIAISPAQPSQTESPPSASKTQDATAKMTFLGRKTVLTDPVPIPNEASRLCDFFADKENRNLLFPNNEANDLAPPTSEQMQKWSEEASLGGEALSNDMEGIPANDQCQLMQITAQLNMPGLKIMSVSTIGAKLFLPDRSSVRRGLEYPEYQFTLLDSELVPEGPAPLVWLFNQLIKYRDVTSSFTRVRAVNAGGVNGDKIVFATDARLETRISIPSLALRLLPVNVDRFERQGSEAVQKLLENELEPALLGFRDAYLEWMER